jgi:hypothetical protein
VARLGVGIVGLGMGRNLLRANAAPDFPAGAGPADAKRCAARSRCRRHVYTTVGGRQPAEAAPAGW